MTNDQGANAKAHLKAGFGAGQGIVAAEKTHRINTVALARCMGATGNSAVSTAFQGEAVETAETVGISRHRAKATVLMKSTSGRRDLDAFAVSVAALILACATFLTACSRKDAETPTAAAAASAPAASTNSDRRVFQVRGVVKEVKDTNTVSIAHQEIPDYMVAMTMDFDVKNTNELSGLAPNDQVTFSMIVTEDDGWIESVRKIGAATPERPALRVVREVEELNIGDKMPDYSFTNSLGQKISLSDFNGQAYAFTFIFTRCPYPTFCPRMNMNFAAAYKQLSEMPNAPTNWHLISISFDPDFDTPARLAEYSKLYKPDPKKWSWVTGAMIDIDAIAEQVNLVFSFEKGTFNHNLRTVVVDKNGIIRQNFRGNEWKPEDLIKEIVAGAEGKEVEKSL